MRQDSSSESIKVSELQNIQVQQLDGISHPQWWRAWQKSGLCPSTFEKGVAVGLLNNMYVKTSTETKQSPTFLKEDDLYKDNRLLK